MPKKDSQHDSQTLFNAIFNPIGVSIIVGAVITGLIESGDHDATVLGILGMAFIGAWGGLAIVSVTYFILGGLNDLSEFIKKTHHE